VDSSSLAQSGVSPTSRSFPETSRYFTTDTVTSKTMCLRCRRRSLRESTAGQAAPSRRPSHHFVLPLPCQCGHRIAYMSTTPRFFPHHGCLVADSRHQLPSRPAVAPMRTVSAYHASPTRRSATATTGPIHIHRFTSARVRLHVYRYLRLTSNSATTSTRSQLESRTSSTTRTSAMTSCSTSSPSFPCCQDPLLRTVVSVSPQPHQLLQSRFPHSSVAHRAIPRPPHHRHGRKQPGHRR
jgi:hypothetical protein